MTLRRCTEATHNSNSRLEPVLVAAELSAALVAGSLELWGVASRMTSTPMGPSFFGSILANRDRAAVGTLLVFRKVRHYFSCV
jgi:hypothetical protein